MSNCVSYIVFKVLLVVTSCVTFNFIPMIQRGVPIKRSQSQNPHIFLSFQPVTLTTNTLRTWNVECVECGISDCLSY